MITIKWNNKFVRNNVDGNYIGTSPAVFLMDPIKDYHS